MGLLHATIVGLTWWVAGYVALVAAIVTSMFWERHQVLTELSTPQSIADWKSWQEDVRHQQTDPGPVARRVPKSDEPPALVLMRDYFRCVAVRRCILYVDAVLDRGLVYHGRR